MAKKKAKEEDHWAEYFRMQLTPEQKAEARKRLEEAGEKARRDGVYDRLLALRGKINMNFDLEELRKDREDRD